MVAPRSSTHGRDSASRTLSISAWRIQRSAAASSIALSARRTKSSLTSPDNPGPPRRHRVALHPFEVRAALASGPYPQHPRAQHVALGQLPLGLLSLSGHCSSTQRSNTPAVARNSAKNTSWPSGAACACSSQRTRMRPPSVSTTIASPAAAASAVFAGCSFPPMG
jgi:hypothetical protein